MENDEATRGSASSPLLEQSREMAPELVELRRDLHRHPELSFQEERTAGVAARALNELGLEVRQGVAGTGVVADLVTGRGPGGDEGPTVALRGDMDALPIQEENDLPYASSVPGVMHACGHDAHTASLVGAARLLVAEAAAGSLPPGRIRFLFQPAEERMDEEGKSGGRRMVEAGVLEGVDAVVGAHVGAHLPAGRIYLREGPLFAGSDELVVTVRGRSAHAARPHEGVDAVVLAAQGVLAVQQAVARKVDPMESGVVTFGTIHGGTAMNVLAEEVTLTGTLRYFREEVHEALRSGVQGAFRALEAQGAGVEVRIVPGYPPVVNHGATTRKVRKGLGEILGSELVQDAEPGMLAEDFSYMAQAAPGVFFWVGAGLPDPRRHHDGCFDIDESALPLAAAALAGAAKTLLEEGEA